MLKDQLFIRERYGLRPTQMAGELAPVIAAALAKIDDVVLGQQEFDPSQAKRLLTIAPNSYVEFAIVPAIVAKLRDIAPGINVRLVPYGNDLVEAGVISGSTEMVLYIWLLRQDFCSRFPCPIRSKHKKRPMVLFGVRLSFTVTTIRGFSLHIQVADAVY